MPPATKRRKVATKRTSINKSSDMATAPAGTKPWKTTTRLTDGGELSQMSRYDEDTSKFTQAVTIKYKEAFTLRPLIMTEGSLKGRRVLVVELFKDYFRFMDLPTEIRLMIYEMLFHPRSVSMKIGTARRKGEQTRPVRVGEDLAHYTSILAVNQQISSEAASVLYGAQRIDFADLGDCLVFLNSIGDMRGYLRDIRVGPQGYMRNKARSVFSKLRDAKVLRGVELDHTNVCGNIVPRYIPSADVATVAADLKTLLTSLHKSRKGSSGLPGVLDLINITAGQECGHCRHGADGLCYECRQDPLLSCVGFKCFEDGSVAIVKCSDLERHCKEMKAKLRSAIAGVLGIEEKA